LPLLPLVGYPSTSHLGEEAAGVADGVMELLDGLGVVGVGELLDAFGVAVEEMLDGLGVEVGELLDGLGVAIEELVEVLVVGTSVEELLVVLLVATGVEELLEVLVIAAGVEDAAGVELEIARAAQPLSDVTYIEFDVMIAPASRGWS